LIRLQFKVHGFSFLPKQPVQSLLAGRRASRLRVGALILRRSGVTSLGRYSHYGLAGYRPDPEASHPVYTEEKDRPVLLVVDQRLSMFFGSQVAMKSVTAAEVAAMGLADAQRR